MRMYQGPSCPDHPFSVELGDTEINTRIWGILAHGAVMNIGSSLVPLTEGVESPWVSLLEIILVCLHQFLLLKTCVFVLCPGSWVCTQHPTRGHLT
jgi:hypothetical protein